MTGRAELKRRLLDADEILQVEPAAGADAGAYSMRMRMCLEAAALAAELELGEEQVRQRLAAAGRAALAVFTAPPAEVGDLDTGRQAEDTSSSNPLTLLYGLYAALAAGEPDIARALAELSPGEYHSKETQASSALSATARTLQTAVLGNHAETERLASQALRAAGPRDHGYPAELRAMAAWAIGTADPDQVIEAVGAAVRASAEARDATDEPAARLELPARGLRGLFRVDEGR